jgi:hypothetical protein
MRILRGMRGETPDPKNCVNSYDPYIVLALWGQALFNIMRFSGICNLIKSHFKLSPLFDLLPTAQQPESHQTKRDKPLRSPSASKNAYPVNNDNHNVKW